MLILCLMAVLSGGMQISVERLGVLRPEVEHGYLSDEFVLVGGDRAGECGIVFVYTQARTESRGPSRDVMYLPNGGGSIASAVSLRDQLGSWVDGPLARVSMDSLILRSSPASLEWSIVHLSGGSWSPVRNAIALPGAHGQCGVFALRDASHGVTGVPRRVALAWSTRGTERRSLGGLVLLDTYSNSVSAWEGSFGQPGLSAARIGDVNADGVGDIATAVGYGGERGAFSDVQLRVFSGRSLEQLSVFEIAVDGELASLCEIACVGDVDSDGVFDLVLGAVVRGSGDGVLLQVSPGHRSVVNSRLSVSAFGRSVRCVGDLDGDGIEELVVSAPDYAVGDRRRDSARRGRVFIVGGASLDIFGELSSSFSDRGDRFGARVDVMQGVGDGAIVGISAPTQLLTDEPKGGRIEVFRLIWSKLGADAGGSAEGASGESGGSCRGVDHR